MEIVKIFLTALATVIVFYATSSMLLAQKQLVASTRLSGYLTYWQNWILEHDLSKVYALGIMWNKEHSEIIKTGGGAAELIKLDERKKKEIQDIKEQLDKGIGLDSSAIVREIQRHPKESLPSILESLKLTKQNVIDGKTFISDEEATALGVTFTHTSIELKMGLLNLMDGVAYLLAQLMSAPPEFDIKSCSRDIAEMLWRGILVSRKIDLMANAARVISSKSVLQLTWQNITTGKRLTKR